MPNDRRNLSPYARIENLCTTDNIEHLYMLKASCLHCMLGQGKDVKLKSVIFALLPRGHFLSQSNFDYVQDTSVVDLYDALLYYVFVYTNYT